MKRMIAGLFLLANVAVPAMADCVSAGHGANMSAAAIQTLLAQSGNVYACYNPTPGDPTKRENNEALSSTAATGSFSEYHNGGSTQEATRGTYSILTASSAGVIKYTYAGGKAFNYNVCTDNVGTTYHFVSTATGTVYNVVVTTGPGTC